ncbi:hypothetical protein OE88DRAFT_1664413 [Heliocybe sulcata]|uniref:BTB domain-containing protein n=1 Tax=Heliocybe sulcata TaxID=5364 RepID=A0A5C3MU35_9AGAM|nr:hypothetical protein OE88DRAFT_1664413 [Heliocybe sulcata]
MCGERCMKKFHASQSAYKNIEVGWGTSELCKISDILKCRELENHDTAIIDYTIREYPDDRVSWPLDLHPPLRTLFDAMFAMFDDADTTDVCFFIRHSVASDDVPRRIYGHKKILSTRCDYFKPLFSSGFAEGQGTIMDPDAFNEHQWEQGSDSDYDDMTEGTTKYEEDGPTTTVTRERHEVDDAAEGSDTLQNSGQEHGKEGNSEEHSAECGSEAVWRNPYSDSCKMDIDSLSLVDVAPANPVSRASVKDEVEGDPIERKRRKVYVTDSSYRTYRALIYYLYTGSIALAPFRSKYRAAKEAALSKNPDAEFQSLSAYNRENAVVISPDGELGDIQWVSAKSLYRLCDKLGVGDLKAAAAKFIHDSLTPETVVHELRSTFSALFPEILRAQDEYLKEHWAEVCKTKSFNNYMADLFAHCPGEHPKIVLKHIMSAVKGSDDEKVDGKGA